jgi:ABC-2 type transport system permease protein
MFFYQLKNELWKLFGKKRTYIGFAMFLLAQNIFVVLFKFTRATRQMRLTLEGNGYATADYISTLTIASALLFPLAYLLMPLYAALIGGDLVAKEAEDGTLRMILARPISRFRLLTIKWLAGAIFSVVLVFVLGLFGIVFCRFWFPWGGLFAFIPGEIFSVFDAPTGLQHYIAAHAMLAIKAISIMGLGFMFSCFNMKPAAATILALSVLFVNAVMQNIPFFKEFENWFLTYHLNLWQLMFAHPIPWWRVWQSLSILIGFNVTFLVIGLTVFQVRDIKS